VAERRNVSPILLRTQGATCEAILETMQDVQMKKKFTPYKETVDLQSQDAQDTIACARGEKMTQECDIISKKTADYALNIKTVKAVLEDVQH
jgi:c-di-AMP phosphodiesterase-like protein